MATTGDPIQHLAELGKQLTCPICLSLFKNAANLTCNHTFCRQCISESMKRASNCPICKVPTTKREVRSALQMDSMVAIYREMEAATGVQICCTQPFETADGLSEAKGNSVSIDSQAKQMLQFTKSRGKRAAMEGSPPQTDQFFKRGKNSVAARTPGIEEGLHRTKTVSCTTTSESEEVENASEERAELNESSMADREAPAETVHRIQPATTLSHSLQQSHSSTKGLPASLKYEGQSMPSKAPGAELGASKGTGEGYVGGGVRNTGENADASGVRMSVSMLSAMGGALKTPSGQSHMLRAHQSMSGMAGLDSRAVHSAGVSKKALTAGTWSLVGCKEEKKKRERVGGSEKKAGSKEKHQNPTRLECARSVGLNAKDSLNQNLVSGHCNDEEEKVNKGTMQTREMEYFSAVAETPSATSPGNHEDEDGSRIVDSTPTISEDADSHPVNIQRLSRLMDRVRAVQQGQVPEEQVSLVEPQRMGGFTRAVKGWLSGRKESLEQETSEGQRNCFQNSSKQASLEPRSLSREFQEGLEPSSHERTRTTSEKTIVVGVNQPTSAAVNRMAENAAGSGEGISDQGRFVGASLDTSGNRRDVPKGSVGRDVPSPTETGENPTKEEDQPSWLTLKAKDDADRSIVATYMRRIPLKDGLLTTEECEDVGNISPTIEAASPGSLQLNTSKGWGKRRKHEMTESKKIEFSDEGVKGIAKRPCCGFCGISGASRIAGGMVQVDSRRGRVMKEGSTLGRHRIQFSPDYVHENCLEWAPEVYFQGNKVQNLRAELNRSQRLRCSHCDSKGAALGCCLPKCRRTYHYPCARKVSGCRWDEERFIMLCPEHADGGFPTEDAEDDVPEASSPVKEDAAPPHSQKLVASPGTRLPDLGKWPSRLASKWVLCGSGLDVHGKKELSRFAAIMGFTLVKQWSPAVSHVVAGLDEKGCARRTLKFLSAILNGQWVVSLEWLTACEKLGKPVSEEAFEVKEDVHGMENGPRRGRLMTKDKKLFEGISFYFCGTFQTPSKADLAAVLTVGGGSIFQREPLSVPPPKELHGNSSSRRTAALPAVVVLYPSSDVPQSPAAQGERRAAKLLSEDVSGLALPHTWLLDSAAKCQLLHMEST